MGWRSIPEEASKLSLSEWLEDLEALEEGMAGHPKFTHDPTTRSAFEASLGELRTELAEASDSHGPSRNLASVAITGIMRVLAVVGDGHTRINASPETRYPIIIRFFPKKDSNLDFENERAWEARLAATDALHVQYLGWRIVGIGEYALGEALSLAGPCLSIESALKPGGVAQALYGHAVRTEVMDAFSDPWLDSGLGLTEADGTLRVSLENDEGVLEELVLAAQPSNSVEWKTVLQAVPQESRHFTRSRPNESRWMGSPPGRDDLLYIRYDDCDSGAGPFFDEILGKLADAGSDSGPKGIIVDLRYNSGGDSRPGYSFARSLRNKAVSKTAGGVVVLVGPATYSSAMQNAADLLAACGASETAPGRAILVGEPLIEPLRHYGEMTRFLLPRSGILVGKSTRLWRYDDFAGIHPERGVLEPAPGKLAAIGFDDYSAGADPIFDTALRFAPAP